MNLRALLTLGLLLACAGFAPRAAATITCTVVSTAPLPYGTVDLPVADTMTGVTQVRVQCTTDSNSDRGDSVRVCVGLNTPTAPRELVGGSNRMLHRLFKDASRQSEINYATVNAEAIVTIPNGGGQPPHAAPPVDIPLYGRLDSATSTSIAPGLYTETISGAIGWGATTSLCSSIAARQALSFQASATARARCTIATNPLNFGTVNLWTTSIDTTSSLGLNCVNGTPWTIRMNGGTVARDVSARQMGLGGTAPGVIHYQLRHTSANGPLWGDGTGATSVLTGTGTGASQTLFVYGRIPSGQAAPPVGTYSDVVTVSVEY